MFNLTLRSLQYKGFTVGFDGNDKLIPTLQFLNNENKPENVSALRGTAYLGGSVKLADSNAHCFFAKPNMGSRATDCFGIKGPQPT